jgi:hypothetical protein
MKEMRAAIVLKANSQQLVAKTLILKFYAIARHPSTGSG